jgi:Zn-dependent peptidase ImmA (M78 family)
MHVYEIAKFTARALRREYGFTTPTVRRSDLRRIYAAEGITIDFRSGFRTVRGAYFWDEVIGPSVMLADGLPDEPTIFTMGHELKHHFMDRSGELDFPTYCALANRAAITEKAAEIFAAELIYPDRDFQAEMKRRGIASGECDAAAIVRLKHETKTTLSYASLAKRATLFGFASPGTLDQIAWRKLEEAMYGEPVYKRIQRRRRLA